ncbi:oligosaccharide flippase family protein [Vibrio sp. Vb2535]|uniref:oligosaccharide flippase family protein n=1 Tax=Vibrio TaxID=662 RepID=UPI002964A863|nr:oligosaccharide flippase family protein [Vibrio sp. Vb2535]MDW1755876.1 oligosaccharide flippase family protein [Vibrio sp. Vb2535]
MKNKLNILTSYASIGSSVALGYILLFLISKYDSISSYGIFILLKSTSGLLSGILSFRTGESVTKYYSGFLVSGKRDEAKTVVVIGVGFDVILACIAFGCSYLIYLNNLTIYINDDIPVDLFLIFSLTSVFYLMRGSAIGYLQGKEKILVMNIINIIESLLIMSLSLLYVFVVGNINIGDIVYIHVFSYGIAFILYAFFLVYYYNIEFSGDKLVLNKELIRDYIRFSLAVFSSSTLKAINRNVDNIVIGAVLSTGAVGVYQAIKKLFSVIEIVAQPWTALVYAKLNKLYVSGLVCGFKELIIQTTIKIFIVSFIIGISLLYFMEDILLSMEVDSDSNLFSIALIFFFGYLVAAASWWARVFSNVVNPMISVKANLASTIYMFTFLPILSFVMGMYGVALSFLILNVSIFIYITVNFTNINKEEIVVNTV